MNILRPYINSNIDEIKNKKMAGRIFKKPYPGKFSNDIHYQVRNLKRMRDFFHNHLTTNSSLNEKTKKRMSFIKNDLNIMIDNYNYEFDLQPPETELKKIEEIIDTLSYSLKIKIGSLIIGTLTMFVVDGFLKQAAMFFNMYLFGSFIFDYKIRKNICQELFIKRTKKRDFLLGGWSRENYKLMKGLLKEIK